MTNTNTNKMTGSVKQITWAQDIKDALDWDGVLDHPSVLKFREIVENINIATWWIDNKSLTGVQMLEMAVSGGFVIEYSPERLLLKIDPQTCEMTINTTVLDMNGPKMHKIIKTEKVEI